MNRNLIIGLTLSALAVIAALVSFVWTPFDHASLNIPDKLQTPNGIHWFGTDHFGRDIFSMIMVGARTSIAVAFVAVGIGMGLGIPLGLWAARATVPVYVGACLSSITVLKAEGNEDNDARTVVEQSQNDKPESAASRLVSEAKRRGFTCELCRQRQPTLRSCNALRGLGITQFTQTSRVHSGAPLSLRAF